MKPTAFDKAVRAHFGVALMPLGFDCSRSRHSTFYRNLGDCWHFILADPLKSGTQYDIKVFASSPLIDPCFETSFPDDLGIPADVRCSLASTGVGLDTERFACRDDAAFAHSFASTVKPRLLDVALPFLDRIQSLESMLPTIHNRRFRAIAMYRLGQRAEARSDLEAEYLRLQATGSRVEVVTKNLQLLETMLASYE